jgi:hypothetical protein
VAHFRPAETQQQQKQQKQQCRYNSTTATAATYSSSCPTLHPSRIAGSLQAGSASHARVRDSSNFNTRLIS